MPKFTCEFDPVDPAIACKLDAISFAIADLKHDVAALKQQGVALMAKFDDYVSAQTAINGQIGAAVDALGVSLTGVSGDVKSLNDQIAALQSSLGTLTPAQQQALDDLTAAGTAVAGRVQAAADALAALDALTPPAPPSGP